MYATQLAQTQLIYHYHTDDSVGIDATHKAIKATQNGPNINTCTEAIDKTPI